MSMLEEMFDGSNRQTINERPYSRTQSAIDSAKGKVKGAFGSGQIEQGAAEVGAEANKLWIEFKRFIGRKYGKAQATVPYADVAQFLKGNNLDPKFLGTNTRRSFVPKDVGQIILSAVREYMNEYRDQEQDQGQSQGGNPPPQPPQGGAGNGGAGGAGGSGGNGDSGNAGGNSGGGSAGGLAARLASLSPAEREQLLRLLG